jgi:hypothetical protein
LSSNNLLCPTNMLKFLALASLVALAAAIPVDNGVEGDPEIECGPTSITINFNTQNSFEGHVYVKNLYADTACRNDEGGRQVAGISLPFDTCNVQRTRSLNPKGVFVRTTVIISFHPLFMTKVDRAYTIQCFYMEADKTVSTDIEVSMITTGFQTQVVPMPICRYEILEGGPTGEPVKYALIGDAVYHKWTCDTETVDTFCMYVYSCFVDDGNGDRVDLLDVDGCAQDRYLMNNLEYPTDLMGGVEAHVFKYADRPQLFFQCQIAITVKEPNEECGRPQCSEPAGRGGGRKRRSVHKPEAAGITDVVADISTLDIDDNLRALPKEIAYRAPAPHFLHTPIRIGQQEGICLSPATFAVFMVLAVALIGAVATISTCLMRREKA